MYQAREWGTGCARCVGGKLLDKELSGLTYLGSAEARTRVCTLTTTSVFLRLITWREDEHMESMFDDSDASSVLRRASKSDTVWLARFTRKRAKQGREVLEIGREGGQYQPRLSLTQGLPQPACPPCESAQPLRAANAGYYPRDAKTGASRVRTHRMGGALAIVRRSARGTVQGGPALSGSFLLALRQGFAG
jgi:hypothetical protein